MFYGSSRVQTSWIFKENRNLQHLPNWQRVLLVLFDAKVMKEQNKQWDYISKLCFLKGTFSLLPMITIQTPQRNLCSPFYFIGTIQTSQRMMIQKPYYSFNISIGGGGGWIPDLNMESYRVIRRRKKGQTERPKSCLWGKWGNTYLWALCWYSLSMIVWVEEEALGCVATAKLLLPLQPALRIKHCICLMAAIDERLRYLNFLRIFAVFRWKCVSLSSHNCWWKL